MHSSVSPTHAKARAALRSQVDRASRGASVREELEYLMADVSAEILLLEVDLRRNEQELLATLGPRVKPPDMQAKVERRTQLRDELADLRELAGEIRARLTQQY